jgi:uncharacterized surface anchored protein
VLYALQWYNNKTDFSAADLVAVTAGETKPDINAHLARYGGMSGRVTDEATGNPIAGASIHVYDLYGNNIASPDTDDNGTYSVSQLAAG